MIRVTYGKRDMSSIDHDELLKRLTQCLSNRSALHIICDNAPQDDRSYDMPIADLTRDLMC